MRTILSVVFLLVVGSSAFGAPPQVPKEINATPGQLVRITLKTDKKIGLTRSFTDEECFFGELVAPAGERQFVFQAPFKNSKPQYFLSFWTEGELTGSPCTITVTGIAPIPPPTPPDPKPPDPKPPDPPTPQPVTSFRMFLVYDPAATYAPGPYGILFGAAVEKSMNEATTLSGLPATSTGWRRISHKADPTTLPAGLKEVWAAAQPKITATPCIVFQVNDKITLEPLPATAADTSALIAKYRGGK